ncbi:MAG TPA: hypothetical protein VMH77_01335 [Steroidobacteraceae bacterium]|nr:hypothetical protein [Steroidobacteraceae bacterium]
MRLAVRRILVGALLLGALGTLACAAARGTRRRRHAETVRDESLRETFPASDPPATQDFAIPANRA